MQGIISLGEALIDFIPKDKNNILFEKNPGGAPANVAVGVSRLRSRSAFIGKVGSDSLGNFLYDTLNKEDVNTGNLILTKEAKTALTLVTLDEKGDRSFEFFVEQSADSLLTEDEIDQSLFEDYKIFHFGSISMIDELSREATKYALDLAVENNMIVSYDPNIRESLWEDMESAKKIIKSVLGKVNILKVSREELIFLTNEEKLESAAEQIKNKNEIDILLITDGENGVYLLNEELVHIPAEQVNVVDTTGAGDAFVAGFLNRIDQVGKNLSELNNDELKKYCEFANYCSSLVIRKQGAMTMMPHREDVIGFLE